MNQIHPTAIIHPSVKMGADNFIGPYVVIGPQVTIGNANRIEGHSSIGQPAEHKDFFTTEAMGVKIGSGCTVREFTTINAGTTRTTVMGDGCIMLRGSHLSHDTIMQEGVTLSCNVLLGGHSYVMRGANIGLGAITDQYTIVGAYAMLGMGAIVPKKVQIEPGKIYVGSPARFLKVNAIGLVRAGVDETGLAKFQAEFRALLRER